MKLATLKPPISWSELARRTYKEAMEDDILGLAAQLAYYFFLALFPALLFMLAVASFFPLAQFTEMLPQALGRFAAPEMVALLRDQLQQISNANHGGILSIGLLGALWSSSAAIVSITSALNRAYDIEDSRPWWKVRLIAIALTIALGVFVLISFTLVLAGPAIADALARIFGFGAVFSWTWNILQWPIAFALITIAVGLVYYFAPDAEQEWVWITPGSILATALWLLASLLFRIYVVSFGDYQATYGALGGVVVLMLWMYLTALAIVIGAEVNAEIEHASPWGKEPGEKVPGQRRKIGLAAARAYWNRSPAEQQPAPAPPAPVPAPAPVFQPLAVPARPSFGDWAAAFALRLLWPRVRRRERG
jgi:membrane protein